MEVLQARVKELQQELKELDQTNTKEVTSLKSKIVELEKEKKELESLIESILGSKGHVPEAIVDLCEWSSQFLETILYT